MKNIIIYLVIIFAEVSCGYDTFGELLPSADEEVNANARLDKLREDHTGANYIIKDDLVFAGWVTANDLSGNFFRTFIIQDYWGAAEIEAGFYDLHNDYPIGQRVVVRAGGLAAGQYNGVMQIGRTIASYSSYRVESFEHPVMMNKYVSVTGIEAGVIMPETKEIHSLDRLDCGRLIKIDSVVLHEDEHGSSWAFPGDGSADPKEGVRNFVDCEGSSIAVITSGYANFAGEYVPDKSISLTGILLFGKFGASKDRFALKIRDLNDVE